MFIARRHPELVRSVGAGCKWMIGRAHGAPLERGMIMISSYKHGAPPEHYAPVVKVLTC